MKRVSNIYHKVYDIDNIIDMCDRVCSRVKNKNKVEKFLLYKSEHIINIRKKLINKDLELSKYNIFFVTDPKCRIVMAQNIEDKIINHLIARYCLVDVFEKVYTDSMCATRIGKGTNYGIMLLKKYLNDIKTKNKNFYCLKIDIKKYFYSIDHKVLKSILRKKIKDRDALYILDNIIDSTNERYINKDISSLKENRINYLINNASNKKLIDEVNQIPLYKFGKGCSIGNQTSQAFGLIYLYEINHFMKEKLHLKYVINYMDDFIILHEDKNYLKSCLGRIEKILLNKYKLELNHNKTSINSIKNGVDFLGFKFYIINNKVIMKLRNRTKKKFKKKARNLQVLLDNGYFNNTDFKKIISSYKGLLKYGDCKSLYYSYVNSSLR